MKWSGTSQGFSRQEFNEVCGAVRTGVRLGRVRVGATPNLEAINELCTLSKGKIAKVLASEEFLIAMNASGLNFRQFKGLTAKQHYALAVMTNPHDRRSFQTRLKDARISIAEWNGWLKVPLFAEVIDSFAEAALGDHMNNAHLALMQQVDAGNMKAIEFYYHRS